MKKIFESRIREGFKQLNLEIPKDKLEMFVTCKNMLVEWNKRTNLTALKEDDEIAIKHFIDSISSLTAVSIENKAYVIDVGTGAGFPGIPIKIILPGIKLLLLDSVKKKTEFLNHLVKELGLKDVTVVHGRAEDLARQNNYREKFDVALSRAVAPLNTLAEYTLPFLRLKGCVISYKGINAEQELKEAANAIKLLGGDIKQQRDIVLFDNKLQHKIIIIEKVHHTPTKYPRKPGKPKKMPIN